MKISNSPPKVFYVYNTIKDELEEYKKKYNIMKENAETLAKRIDKAIENINKYEEIHGINYMFENEDFKEELLEILKNGGVKDD